jgi:hypothetical protein
VEQALSSFEENFHPYVSGETVCIINLVEHRAPQLAMLEEV